MGQGKKILIIGRNINILSKITDMLNQNGYQTIGKLTNEEAISVFQSETIDVVIIGGGVDSESRLFFHSEFSKINPFIKIIDSHPQTVLSDLRNAFLDSN